MNRAVSTPPASLSRLSIDKNQRPKGSGRGGLVLLLAVIIVLCIGSGAGWWYYKTTGTNILAAVSEKPVKVSLYEIPRAQAGETGEVALVANGKIVSDVIVNVATKVSGQITALYVEQGDDVEKDQVLAKVEDDVYRAQRDEATATVQRLRHAIEKTKAEHRRQLASIREAEATLAWQKFNYERLSKLEGGRNASEVELVEAKHLSEGAAAGLEVARAAAEATAEEIQVIQADLEAAEAVLRLRQKRLDDCDILAPIAGVVLERNAQIGGFLAAEGGRGANANAQLVSIADMTRLRVEIDVSEKDVHRVSQGQRARITPDADKSETLPGHVMWVDPIGDYARAIVQVKVRIEGESPQLRVEGSAKVEFLLPERDADETNEQKVFWLPLDAVYIPAEGQACVYTIEEDRASAVPVTIGARTNREIEVLSGVYAGMNIISDTDEVKQGTLVTVTD